MSRKINYKLDEEFFKEYYEKRKQLRELAREVEVLTLIIKENMVKRKITHDKVGIYSITLRKVNKPLDKFYALVKEKGLEQYLKVGCTPKNYELICKELGLDESKYSEYHYDQLFVKEKKKDYE